MDIEYKYRAELEALIGAGYDMPEVSLPNDKEASRFVFSDDPNRNHLPVCVSNPKRVLPGPIKTSGYALSCFGDSEKAKVRYAALKASFKQIQQAIGDSLAEGSIMNEDGRITAEDAGTSHFDLYESISCDLNKTFTKITKL